MLKAVLKLFLLAGMLSGLPLAGVWLAGLPVRRLLAFPPRELYVNHAPFSWPVFVFVAVLIGVSVFPFLSRGIRAGRRRGTTRRFPARPFPWWGWLGLWFGICWWVLAWTRAPWFRALQPHTFTPLWLCFILVVNALIHRSRGQCPMLEAPGFFLLLFPASALFWWFFEYLNRFVQNWVYVEVPAGSWVYILRATPPFSTVLPAVYSVARGLEEIHGLQRAFKGWKAWTPRRPRLAAVGVLTAALLSLGVIGVFPNLLFPLLWMSPLLILSALQALFRAPHPFSTIAGGDWTRPVAWALAALVCGFFWEMWNFWSLAKWTYHVPWVQRFHVFEMPLLGFAGYLPFGLECAAVVLLLRGGEGLRLEDALRYERDTSPGAGPDALERLSGFGKG